jgi:hypothetical protein
MNSKRYPQLPIAIVSLVIGLSNAMAQNPSPPTPAAPSKETREKMATAHERMAACLRTDKPIAECHAQIMKSVGHVPGATGCPMMSAGMHGQMMQDQSAPARTVPPPGTQK